MNSLNLDVRQCRYRALLGTGGVGSGSFFALDGNHTLGREESRGGRFLERQDYCKLHIICHYIQLLLGTSFKVIIASKVGEDEYGCRLLAEMLETGLDTRFITTSPGDATLYSICFVYPDGTGGNLTASNAATSKVDPAFINELLPEFAGCRGQGIALAAPEVPLPARHRLLELGTEYGFFRAASFTYEEACSEEIAPLLAQCDLVGLNLGEAAALGRVDPDLPALAIVQAATSRLHGLGSTSCLSVTGGKLGSWCWDGDSITHTPAFPVEPVNTAGAGDSHLAGLLIGRTAGLSWPVANQLAALVAALKVTSAHTIHKGLDRQSLSSFARITGAVLDPAVWHLIKNHSPGEL
jgi:sugar/nucleoside kinase (ribokinase family)